MLRQKLKENQIKNPGKFRFRGTDNTRIEALSDGVFALATALLIISNSIPKSYAELMLFLDDLLPFTICIVLLILIWYQHYVFFIRYGFKDATIVAINTFLLILILFYIYPLKFLFQVLYQLFTGLFTGNDEIITHLFTVVIPADKTTNLMIIYGLGAFAIFFTLALMYYVAYRRKESLELTESEIMDTRFSMYNNILMAAIPLLSAMISIFGPDNTLTFTISGFTYWLYMFIMPAFGTYTSRKKRKLMERLEPQDPS